MAGSSDYDDIPEVRDGLSHKERVILYCLGEARREFAGGSVPTVTLYGRVVEHVAVSQEEFQAILSRLTGAVSDTRD